MKRIVPNTWFILPALAAIALLAACQSTSTTITPTKDLRGLGTPLVTQKKWANPPPMLIDQTKYYVANFKTAKGDFRVQLLADKAPFTVNNFIFLAREGYYNNTTFHRVIEDFMAQGGDPSGTGSGGPGYTFDDEIAEDLKFDKEGVLAMANYGTNTNGSQFFITFKEYPDLNGRYTIFGQVISGMDVVHSLKLRDPNANPTTPGDTLYSVTIEETPINLLPPPTATSTLNVPRQTPSVKSLATLEVTARGKIFTGPPDMVIDPTHGYRATIMTTKGNLVFDLCTAEAPESVNNFVVLARMGYWDNFPINYATRHKFLLTGLPTGMEDYDIGYSLPHEDGCSNNVGVLGYWTAPRGAETDDGEEEIRSSAGQLYILLVTDKSLDGKLTAFGRLIGDDALLLANELTTADKIISITVVDTGTAPTVTQTRTPGPTRTATPTRTETPTPTPSPTK
ncbi:MAG: peptidylprolyl isomerase [Anaerolineales bacterium]|nr:peptidylprolyl isomerase [Anaerolineales bacterium]